MNMQGKVAMILKEITCGSVDSIHHFVERESLLHLLLFFPQCALISPLLPINCKIL